MEHLRLRKNDPCPANTKFNKLKGEVWGFYYPFFSPTHNVFAICSQIHFFKKMKKENHLNIHPIDFT